MISIAGIEKYTNRGLRLRLDSNDEIYAEERCDKFMIDNDDGTQIEIVNFYKDYETRKYEYYINHEEIDKNQLKALLLKSNKDKFIHDVIIKIPQCESEILSAGHIVKFNEFLSKELSQYKTRQDCIIRFTSVTDKTEGIFINDIKTREDLKYCLYAYFTFEANKSAMEDGETNNTKVKMKSEIWEEMMYINDTFLLESKFS